MVVDQTDQVPSSKGPRSKADCDLEKLASKFVKCSKGVAVEISDPASVYRQLRARVARFDDHASVPPALWARVEEATGAPNQVTAKEWRTFIDDTTNWLRRFRRTKVVGHFVEHEREGAVCSREGESVERGCKRESSAEAASAPPGSAEVARAPPRKDRDPLMLMHDFFPWCDEIAEAEAIDQMWQEIGASYGPTPCGAQDIASAISRCATMMFLTDIPFRAPVVRRVELEDDCFEMHLPTGWKRMASCNVSHDRRSFPSRRLAWK